MRKMDSRVLQKIRNEEIFKKFRCVARHRRWNENSFSDDVARRNETLENIKAFQIIEDLVVFITCVDKDYGKQTAGSILHLLLFITRKYTIINANLKLINAKLHSFYSVDIH